MNRRRHFIATLLLIELVMIVMTAVVSIKVSGQLRSSAFAPLLIGSLAALLSLAILQGWSASLTRGKKARIILGIAATQVGVLTLHVPLETPVRLTAAGLALAVVLWTLAPRLRRTG